MSSDESSVSHTSDDDVRVRLVESFDIEQLRSLNVFQQQVEAAAAVCSVPIATIALVGREDVHPLSAVGNEVRSRPRSETLGDRVVSEARALVSEDVSRDERLGGFVPTIKGREVCFYFGQPLMIDNSIVVGTLSLIDYTPRRIGAQQRAALASIGRQIELQLEYIARQESSIEQAGLAAEVALSHHVDARRQAITNFLLHDVINAATAVKADADYVRARAQGGPDVAEALVDIAEAVDMMAELLQSAREVLLQPDATLASFGRDVDLSALLEELCELHRPQLRRDGRGLEVVGELSQPCVGGDQKLLREMFESLFGATLAATPAGSDIEIRFEEPDPQSVEIVYCDEGDPMSDRLKHRLRGDSEIELSSDPELDVARDSIEALSLCTMIVEAHGGTMRIESTNGDGRRFRILLPR